MFHAHTFIPAVVDVLRGSTLERTATASAAGPLVMSDERVRLMDEQGIDVEVLSINPWWYGADRELAGRIVDAQNKGLAALCAARPDRFVALATVPMQHPDLAAEQLDDAAERLKLSARGYHRVLRVARTLADLDGAAGLARLHVANAGAEAARA